MEDKQKNNWNEIIDKMGKEKDNLFPLKINVSNNQQDFGIKLHTPSPPAKPPRSNERRLVLQATIH